MELQELMDFWEKKYPNVSITLWANSSPVKYFGKLRTHEACHNLKANTIGELIGHVEDFLRTVKR